MIRLVSSQSESFIRGRLKGKKKQTTKLSIPKKLLCCLPTYRIKDVYTEHGYWMLQPCTGRRNTANERVWWWRAARIAFLNTLKYFPEVHPKQLSCIVWLFLCNREHIRSPWLQLPTKNQNMTNALWIFSGVVLKCRLRENLPLI